MHPDALIAALKAELAEARDADHKKDIEAEIKRVEGLPRPKAQAAEPETVFDRTRAYLDALKAELAEAVEERHSEIKAEIKRVEGLLHKSGKAAAPAAGEDEDLSAKPRKDLDARAVELGVEDPDKLPNKDAVIEAIEAARAS